MAEVDYNALTFFLAGGELGPMLYEQLFGRALNVLVRLVRNPFLECSAPALRGDQAGGLWRRRGPAATDPAQLRRLSPAAEYFTLPERFLFFQLNGLKGAALPGDQLDIIITFRPGSPAGTAGAAGLF